MKRVILLAAAIALTGCASHPQTKIEQTAPAPTKLAKYEPAAATASAQLKVPDWFIQPPENTDKSTWSVGEATGASLSMTVQKAMLDADAKLAFQLQSRVETMIKSFKTDTGGKYGAESSEMLAKKIANATVIGHHRVDSQITQEGSVYRVFVLMRYPMGESNKLLEAETAAKQQRTIAMRERQAAREMRESQDRNAQADRDQERRDAGIVEESQSKVTPVVVAPATEKVTTANGQVIELLDVDNKEYRAKRAEALEKPNAVVGQATYR